jgi:HD superfamily phosphohydrolase
MDYLLRDSYFTGVEYGQVDTRRIINSLSVAEEHLALERAALYAFEAMLLARYQMFKTVYFHRTVRAAQLMLVHSMKLADESLHLTDLADIGEYLELTDEAVLQRLTTLDANSRNLKTARRLARDFRDRRLVKCVYERLMLRKDRAVEQLFEKDRVRNRVLLDISTRAKVDRMHVYLDVPTVPSVPYTSSREMLTSITTVNHQGGKTYYETIPISQLPLVGSIAGFMNILRVYTQSESRLKVFKATSELFGKDKSLVRMAE